MLGSADSAVGHLRHRLLPEQTSWWARTTVVSLPLWLLRVALGLFGVDPFWPQSVLAAEFQGQQ